MTAVRVTLAPDVKERSGVVAASLIDAQAASRTARRDPTVWGPDAEPEASQRLGWVGLAARADAILDELEPVIASCREMGLSRVVLAGMGGSSLAPEVMCAGAGTDLFVLDSTHPDHVAEALRDVESTVFVIASKSGSTIETDSARRQIWKSCRDAGLNAAEHLIAITDPGSALGQSAEEEGWLHVFYADPEVGGRFSALSAFGIVPSALAGLDVTDLVSAARQAEAEVAVDSPANPALALAAGLATVPWCGTHVFEVVGTDAQLRPAGVWVEQLVAESTGKHGTGLLPIAQPGSGAEFAVHLASGGTGLDDSADIIVNGTLGAQLIVWEYATALLGSAFGVNPFDQPNVESSKASARELLGGSEPRDVFIPGAAVGSVRIAANLPELAQSSDLNELCDRLRSSLHAQGSEAVLVVQAFLDRTAVSGLTDVRFAPDGCPQAVGFGPRYLHSTGQYHKGGYPSGIYVQIVDEPAPCDPIPGLDFSFAELIHAQADGDAAVLHELGRPIVRLTLSHVAAGLEELRQAFAR